MTDISKILNPDKRINFEELLYVVKPETPFDKDKPHFGFIYISNPSKVQWFTFPNQEIGDSAYNTVIEVWEKRAKKEDC